VDRARPSSSSHYRLRSSQKEEHAEEEEERRRHTESESEVSDGDGFSSTSSASSADSFSSSSDWSREDDRGGEGAACTSTLAPGWHQWPLGRQAPATSPAYEQVNGNTLLEHRRGANATTLAACARTDICVSLLSPVDVRKFRKMSASSSKKLAESVDANKELLYEVQVVDRMTSESGECFSKVHYVGFSPAWDEWRPSHEVETVLVEESNTAHAPCDTPATANTVEQLRLPRKRPHNATESAHVGPTSRSSSSSGGDMGTNAGRRRTPRNANMNNSNSLSKKSGASAAHHHTFQYDCIVDQDSPRTLLRRAMDKDDPERNQVDSRGPFSTCIIL
jgi:hypothetical protein